MPRQRVTEPGAVRQDQIGLQLGQPVVGDAGIGEQPEAGVDAIDGLAGSDDAVDGGGGIGDALQGGVVETRFGATPQLTQGGEVDIRRV